MNMKSVFYAVPLFKDSYDFLICVGDFKKSKFKSWDLIPGYNYIEILDRICHILVGMVLSKVVG